MFTVEAIICTYNKLDILPQTIAHLRKNGIRVYVMDNWSTDGTWEWLQKHGVEAERFPAEGRPEKHSHFNTLRRKEELFLLRKADWSLHCDADELICSRDPKEKLVDAIKRLDSIGTTIVNCELVDYIPHVDGWKGEPVETFFTRTQITAVNKLTYYRAWKNSGERVNLADSGGHKVELPRGQASHLSNETLVLKHYSLRSQKQADRKVFQERQGCWDPVEEQERGWHQHYYWYKPGYRFVRDVPVVLLTLSGYQDTFDQFNESVKKSGILCDKMVVVSDKLKLVAPGWTVLEGREPFSFSKNVNVGLDHIKDSDVFLCNDDVQFLGDHVVEKLQDLAYSDPTIGVLAPQVHGICGNERQCYKGPSRDLVDSKERLAFISVYLKRDVLARLGRLDEDFDEYGGEDTEYCIRAQHAGYRLVSTPLVQVVHGFGQYAGTATFQRKGYDIGGGVARMEAKLQAKLNGRAVMGPGGYCVVNRPVEPTFCCPVHERQWRRKEQERLRQEALWA